MRKYLYITLLVLPLLACGVSSTLPNHSDPKVSADVKAPSQEVEDTSIEMIVTADEGLNIRVCPGVNCMELDEDLRPGEVVTCTEFSAPMNGDSGLWCLHSRGWSNARYMEVVK